MWVVRAGFLLHAAALVASVVLGLWLGGLWRAETPDLDTIRLVNDALIAVAAAGVVGLFGIARTRITPIIVAGWVALLDLCVDVGLRFALMPSSFDSATQDLVVAVRGWVQIALGFALSLLYALAVGAMGRALGAARPAMLALVALALAGAGLGIAGRFELWAPEIARIVYYAHAGLVVALDLALAVRAARLPTRATTPTERTAIDAGWRGVAIGIRLCLLAIVARVVFSVIAIVVMRGAAGASDYSALRRVGDGVLSVAVLSGLAGLVMLVGLFRIGRAPLGAGAMAHLALFLFGGGMIVDAIATKVTLSALESVSAAFFAQDALPGLAAVAMSLGIGAAASLISALRQAATALGRDDLAASGGTTATLLVVAGLGGAFLQLSAQHIPFAAFVTIGVVVLPLLLYAAGRFLLLAVAVAREIDARADDP